MAKPATSTKAAAAPKVTRPKATAKTKATRAKASGNVVAANRLSLALRDVALSNTVNLGEVIAAKKFAASDLAPTFRTKAYRQARRAGRGHVLAP